jgi:hypothetical protein
MFIGGFGFAALLNNYARVKHLIIALVLTALFYFIVTITLGFDQLFNKSYTNPFIILNRFFLTPRNPNDIGAIMAFLCSYMVVLINKTGIYKSLIKRPWYYFIIVGSFLNFYILDSRTGVLLSILLTLLYFSYFKMVKKSHIVLILLSLIFLISNYNVYFEENFLIYTTSEQKFQNIDGRSKIYYAFFNNLNEIFWTGVGHGNFVKDWGYETEFTVYGYHEGKVVTSSVQSAHNFFFQLVINGGISILIFFVALLKKGYQFLPKRNSDDIIMHGIFLYSCTMFFLLFLSHNFSYKEFSIFFAILISKSLFIPNEKSFASFK